MRAATYARVSTEDQTYENQLLELHSYIDRMGWTLVRDYVDVASGASSARPGLRDLLAGAQRREFDVLLVYKLDRLGRSVTDLVNNLHLLSQYGIRFISISQGIDTIADNPASKLLMHVLAAIAEFERSLIQDRIRSGLRRARQSGRQLGRPKTVFDVEDALRLREQGMSLRQISRRLGVPYATLRRRIADYGTDQGDVDQRG